MIKTERIPVKFDFVDNDVTLCVFHPQRASGR